MPEPPSQMYPDSILHVSEYPSFEIMFPSSQVSDPALYPSVHFVIPSVLLTEVLIKYPDGQVTVTWIGADVM